MSELKKKNLRIVTSEGEFERHPIKTHFVSAGEDYIELVEKYVLPVYQQGDILSVSEKIIALCQNRIIKRSDIRVSFIAKTLSRFASHPSHGIGVGESIKMQFAIDEVGLPKVLYASVASAVTKFFGKKGVFYEIVGQEVSGLDGFYDHIWEEYRDIGIRLPENPDKVCSEIEEKTGVECMLVDANDYGQELLGKSRNIIYNNKILLETIKDNPAGQGKECTPFVIIRKV